MLQKYRQLIFKLRKIETDTRNVLPILKEKNTVYSIMCVGVAAEKIAHK
jgi:hypothetical protein